jgi:hypothetical protein
MRIHEYEQLCANCDAILRLYGDNDPEIVAVSSLHVLTGHPSNTEHYKPSRANAFLLLSKFFCESLYRIVRSFFEFPRFLSTYYGLDPDVVIFSHLLNPEQLKSDTDFYFGSLSQALTTAGKNNLYVLLNHTGKNPAQLWSDPNANVISRLPVLKILSPLDEVCIAWSQWRLFIRLRLSTIARKLNIPNLAFEPLSRQTSANLRFYRQVLFLLRKFKTSSVVATYEGHAWERLAFYAARKANPHVSCIAYQHAVIFPMQHSIKRSLGPNYDPDTILFSGEYGRDWFVKHADYEPTLSVVGTPRHDCIATSDSSSPKLRSSSSSCLLLPDGTLSESLAIFRFGVLCASQISDIRFVIRLHPVLTCSTLLSADPSLRDIPFNFIISDKSIQSDFLENRWALYRGSGAGVRAAISGVRPIYYNIPSIEMSIDPLHMLSSWRREAKTVEDVASILHADLSALPASIDAEYLSVRKALGSVFCTYSTSRFLRHV